MNKFWKYESGEVKIDEQRLYESLILKGIGYFKPANDDFKYIVIYINNTVEIYFEDKLWRFCCWLIEKEFPSVAEEERTQVKKALKECRKTLKKSKLAQLNYEVIEKCEDTASKRFIQKLIKKSNLGEEVQHENLY